MKKGYMALLAVLLLVFLHPVMAEDKPDSFPKALQFTQSLGLTNPRKQVTLVRLTPHTARKDVDQAIRAVMEEMEAKAEPLYRAGAAGGTYTRVTIGPTVHRNGTKWLSFLTICTVDVGTERVYLDFDARSYDMETGEQLTLASLFPQDSDAWALLSQEIRSQLAAYFMTEQPDEAALDALCTREAVEQAAFTLSAGALVLHYRADALYPGHETMMNVRIYYPDLWAMMTEEAREQTDNRRYKLVALTFDDGCAGVSSMGVINLLRQYGANATFFVVGTNMANNDYVLAQEHDTGFTIASHNYVHDTHLDSSNPEQLLAWKKQFEEELDAVVGVRPTMMRAPGGLEQPFLDAGIDLPLIHWSVSSGDAYPDKTTDEIYRTVVNAATDGQVILMHDGHSGCSAYLRKVLPLITQNGVLCVSVDELYRLYGVELEPNKVYYYPGQE